MITQDRDSVLKQLNLSEKTVEKLDKYVDLLEREQTKMNLVGASTLPVVWTRHVLDSAQLFDQVKPDDKTVLDFGSGAGFPALVLAIMDAGQKHDFRLIESDGKKCAFLNKVISECGLRATVCNERIEKMEKFGADLITARALASLDKLLKYAFPFFKKTTRCLFMKGAKASDEIDAARRKYDFRLEKIQSVTSAEGTILLLSEVKKK
ncbi:MAG TPA: 16S rRNA (guanine(527)-N(7))-methyltransferase RsmG [Alphaproteobacteria bacterium]|nr:16S rRNA (guanine(527)-N(7))-methyltransferase RsmG [Alphaproteobacteria bacterium]